MTAFSRTSQGKSAKAHFLGTPLIWVEGPSDIGYYEPLAHLHNAAVEPAHGKEECLKLIQNLRDNKFTHPYVVIIDGDYDVLNKPRPPHPYVVALKRYSIENYLWNEEAVTRVILRESSIGNPNHPLPFYLSDVEIVIYDRLNSLIASAIAHDIKGSPLDVIPEKIDTLCNGTGCRDICETKCQTRHDQILNECHIETEDLTSACEKINTYISKDSFINLVSGHLLVSILRRYFRDIMTALESRPSQFNEKTICRFISDMVWRIVPTRDHQYVIDRLALTISRVQSSPKYTGHTT